MQPVANEFAEVIAPGLSNRIRDARWITILCWCLKQSERARNRWLPQGEEDSYLLTSRGSAERYQWVRPLELLWIYLGTRENGKRRQLPGKRSIQSSVPQTDNTFGLSSAQLGRYRNTGVYGSYRKSLRKLVGLTNGDGWTLGDEGSRLADWLNDEIKKSHRQKDLKKVYAGIHPMDFFRTYGKQWHYKLESKLLPQEIDSPEPLPKMEQKILANVLFETNGSRRHFAKLISGYHGVLDAGLYAYLAKKDERLSWLPGFHALTEPAITILFKLAKQAQINPNTKPDFGDFKKELASLRKAAKNWTQGQVTHKPHKSGIVDRFAQDINNFGGNDESLLTRLVAFHQDHGGGRRWIKINEEGNLENQSEISANDHAPIYYYRIFPLAALAVQCGVITAMPNIYSNNSTIMDEQELEEA